MNLFPSIVTTIVKNVRTNVVTTIVINTIQNIVTNVVTNVVTNIVTHPRRMTWTSRNMAVLASVQDRVEVWNRSVKMPEVEEDDMGKS